jgi:hypothetical protein
MISPRKQNRSRGGASHELITHYDNNRNLQDCSGASESPYNKTKPSIETPVGNSKASIPDYTYNLGLDNCTIFQK